MMRMITKAAVGLLSLTLLGVVWLSMDRTGTGLAQQEGTDPQVVEPTAEAEGSPEVVDPARTDPADVNQWAGPSYLLPQQAVVEALDAAVNEGVLTQAEADQIVADVEARAAAMVPGGAGHRIETRPLGDNMFGELTFQFEGSEGAMGIRPYTFFHGEPGIGVGGFVGALHEAVAEGILSPEEREQIMLDFAELAGELVTAELPKDGAEGEARIVVEGLAGQLQEAQSAALDKAVAAGVLTAEQADIISEKAAQAPDLTGPETFFFEGEALPFTNSEGDIRFELRDQAFNNPTIIEAGGDPLLAMLTHHLENAVAGGKLSQAEMDELIERLTEALTD